MPIKSVRIESFIDHMRFLEPLSLGTTVFRGATRPDFPLVPSIGRARWFAAYKEFEEQGDFRSILDARTPLLGEYSDQRLGLACARSTPRPPDALVGLERQPFSCGIVCHARFQCQRIPGGRLWWRQRRFRRLCVRNRRILRRSGLRHQPLQSRGCRILPTYPHHAASARPAGSLFHPPISDGGLREARAHANCYPWTAETQFPGDVGYARIQSLDHVSGHRRCGNATRLVLPGARRKSRLDCGSVGAFRRGINPVRRVACRK